MYVYIYYETMGSPFGGNPRNVKQGGYNKSSFPIINKEDYEILYGLILGDVYISRKNTENASLRFEQSIIHKDYLEHLFNKFSVPLLEAPAGGASMRYASPRITPPRPPLPLASPLYDQQLQAAAPRPCSCTPPPFIFRPCSSPPEGGGMQKIKGGVRLRGGCIDTSFFIL
nr:hypothetical protein [Morchella crassipes]